MSGITLEDIANDETMNAAESDRFVDMGEYDPEVVDHSRRNEFLKKLITAETGPGSIGEYVEHPMNFNQSRGLARLLRGLTGLIGNLNLAIIDVGLGVLEFSKERKQDGIIGGDGRNY